MNSKATVDIAYVGPALVGRMDVRELAPALLMMGALLEDANRVLNGDASKVRVLVKSDFRTGSFQVGLEVIQSLLDTAKALLEIGKHVDAVRLLEYIGFAASGSASLIALIKWLRGRKIENITVLGDGCVNIIVKGDDNNITVDQKVFQLYKDEKVRTDADGLVAPLDRDGIEHLTISNAGEEIETIEKDERPYFAVPEVGLQELPDSTFTANYRIMSAAFEPQIKWRLFDGTNKIMASIKDKAFLRDVEAGLVTFTNGDAIKARMRLRQWTGPEGLKSEFEVVEVVEHIKRHPSTQLLLSEPDESP